jgi:hypothetical protein
MSTYIDQIAKDDDKFVARATHPVRRAAAIADLAKARKKAFWLLIVASASFFIYDQFASNHSSEMLALLFVCIAWASYSRIESDLRLLRIIDHLQKDDKPVA